MVEQLINRARRRFVLNEGLAQTALAAAVAIGGFALLLIVGTRYLEAWTVGIFAVAGVAIGAWQLRRRVPGQYETARRVDENAGLKDALSTALYFSHHEPTNGSGSAEFRQSQREYAEKLSDSVLLETAVPFTFPRAVYVMAGLAVLVSLLIGLRYSAGRGIDLRAPITQVLFQDLAAPLAGKKDSKKDARSSRSAMDKAIDQALEGPRPPDNKEPDTKKGETKADASNPAQGDPMENNNDPSLFDDVDLEGKQAFKEGDKTDDGDKKNPDLSPSEKESLLSKLKEAVENLLSKEKKEGQEGEKNQQQAKSDSKKSQKKGEKSGGQKGDKQKGKDDQASEQEAEADAEAELAKQNEKSKQNNAAQSQQPAQEGDGIGKQDGKKEIRIAEQLKAMGKISEIIGQRNNDVSGETTIELQSGDQNLTTAYSNTKANHGESDGDVTRDQIPLAMQAYVQEYFQQVRKASAPPKTTAPAATPPASVPGPK